MSFVSNCPTCHKAVTVTQDLVGRAVACPHCAERFSVPSQRGEAIPIAIPQTPPMASSSLVRFTFTCQRCGSILEARQELCGQSGTCPTCGAVFVVPEVDPQTHLAKGPASVEDDGQLPTPMHAYATAGRKAPRIQRLESGEQVIICPRCRAQVPVDANTCGACGIPFTMEGAASVAIGPDSNGYATAAVTVGILAVLSACIPLLAPVAIILGIVALRRAGKGPSGDSGRKFAHAGIILGIVAIGVFATLMLLRLY